MEAFIACIQRQHVRGVHAAEQPDDRAPTPTRYWSLILCNCCVQFLWFRRCGRTCAVLFVISIVVNIGMWLERYVIVVTSLHRDFVPAAWGMYHGTFWDWATYFGTLGLFLFLLFLFIRVLPVISIAEMRELVHETQERAGHGHGHSSTEVHGETR